MTKIFISYQRESEKEARELYQRLTDEGFDVWQDVEKIRHTDRWPDVINDALRSCDRMILLMTPKSMESIEVREEWFYFRNHRKPLHCLLLSDCDIHYKLLPYQYLDWRIQDKRPWGRLFDELRAEFVHHADGDMPSRLPNMDEYCRIVHQQSKQSNLLMALSETDDFRKRTISIDEIYTPLYLQRKVKRTPDGQPILKVLPHEVGDKEDDLSLLSAMESANAYPRLVLLGDPGSGKTIFMNYLALCMTGAILVPDADWMTRLQTQGWANGTYLPVSIVLRDFAEDLTDTSFDAVFHHLQAVFTKQKFDMGTLEAVQYYIKAGQALILFDGLDEVPPEKREQVRDALHAFMGRFSDNRYIVTCRILSYADPKWHLRDMDAVETFAPLNSDQIAHFVNAWYTVRANLLTISHDEAQKRIAELTERLEDNDLQEMATNPMLLTVMTFVHNSTGTLPKEKARLYDQCVDWLMRRWKLEEFNTLFKLLKLRGEKDLYKILWEIAYHTHNDHADKDGVADINEADILAIVRKYVDNDMGLAQKFCDYIQYRAGLLIGRGVDKRGWRIFTFPHRTFQEFLAGQYLLTNDFEELAPDIARLGAGWREVMLLACGYLIYEQANDAEVIKAVGAILDDDPQTDTDWRAVWLAGEMLSIVKLDNITKSNRGKRVLERTQTLLVQLIEGGHLPPVERAGAGRILSQLGDPRPGVGTITVNGVTLPDIVWCHVPAGAFIMGSDDHYDDEKPAHTIDLPDFYMSRYLITYAQYQAFENAPDFGDDKWWDGFPADEKRRRYDQRFQYANHPRERVTWYMAMAFCRWLTHHVEQAQLPMQVWDMTTKTYQTVPYQRMKITLPSEAEYEKASRGTKGLIYPYGDKFDPTKGNTPETGIGMTSAVGLFPDGESPYGVLDASGNLWTWTRSKIENYKYNSNDGREDETGTDVRIVRGGSWGDFRGFARASYRLNYNPDGWNYGFGFFVACRPY